MQPKIETIAEKKLSASAAGITAMLTKNFLKLGMHYYFPKVGVVE
jgi:hypothetical protein